MNIYVLYFEKPSAFTNKPPRLIYIDDKHRHGKTNTLRNAIKAIRKSPDLPDDWRIKRLPNEWYFEGNKAILSYVYVFEY